MFNIQEFLSQKNIEYRTSGKNVGSGNINICCLFCGEGRFHLSLSLNKEVYSCWICGEKGNYEKLISKLLNISYIEAKELINPQNDLKKVLEERKNKMEIIEEKPNKNNKLDLPPYTNPFVKDSSNIWQIVAHRFLVNKYNLSWEQILEAKLHYCYFGKYKNSIIIPIYKDEKLVNFIGRVWVKNSKKRYINCSNEESLVNTKDLLYNIDNIKTGSELLIIVEGAMDAIKTGLDRTVATLGSEISQEQINLLVELKPKKIIVLADNDPGNPNTVKKAQKICDYLSPFMNTKMIEIPYMGKDPADLTKNELANLLNI